MAVLMFSVAWAPPPPAMTALLTEVGAGNALELSLNKTTNDYRYRVKACNRLDALCSDPGGELLMTVIDTPQPFAAAVACDNACVQISGMGFDRETQIQVRAQDDATLLATYRDSLVAVAPDETPDTLQFSLTTVIETALQANGLRLTLINPGNGNRSVIDAFPGNDNPLIDLEGGTPTVDANGVIYVPTGNRVYAYDSTGNPVANWPFTAAGDIDNQTALSLTHDTLYAGTTNGILHAIGAAGQSDSGVGRWQTALGDEALAPPLVDELDTVNLGSLNHNFYSVDPDGRIRWAYNTSEGIAERAVPYGDFSLTFHSLDKQRHTIRAGVIGPHLLTWGSRDDSLLADYLERVNPEAFADYVASGWDVIEMFHVGRLFEGLLQRRPDRETLTFWTYAQLEGASLEEVADAFLQSDTAVAFYGELSNTGFLQALYRNLLGIADAEAQPDHDQRLADLIRLAISMATAAWTWSTSSTTSTITVTIWTTVCSTRCPMVKNWYPRGSATIQCISSLATTARPRCTCSTTTATVART